MSEAPKKLLTYCAWCQVNGIETVLVEGDPTGPISHGICEAHATVVFAQRYEDYLEREANRARTDPAA